MGNKEFTQEISESKSTRVMARSGIIMAALSLIVAIIALIRTW